MRQQRNLLLCFDAFGTLFKPTRPIPEQYMTVARQYGLEGFGLDQLEASFKSAFKGELLAHPNYGKASGMGAEKWWTNVIHKTFQSLLAPGREVPKELAPGLLHRFSSNEAYTTSSDILSLLRLLKHHQSSHTRSSLRGIVVGVVTNSDDRVPGILSSLGFYVSPLRFGHNIDTAVLAREQYDIDLHCMSYDVGFAKPDRRIFDAAEAMANTVIAMQNGAGPARDGGRAEGDVPWLKLYVGDEFQVDVVGARGAGWNSILVGPETDSQEQLIDIGQTGHIPLDDVFPLCSGSTVPVALRAGSARMVLEWLITQRLEND